MSLSCPICTDTLAEGVVATSCGHVFHSTCLDSWLQNNRTCPMCKVLVTRRSIIKLFINTAEESLIGCLTPGSSSQDTAEKCDRYRRNIAQLEKKLESVECELETYKWKIKEKEDVLQTVMSKNENMEKQLTSLKHKNSAMQTKMLYLTKDAEHSEKLKKRLSFLERQIKSFHAIKAILESDREECEEIVTNMDDKESLGQFVIGLKREYTILQKSKSILQEQFEDVQKKLSYSRLTIENLRESIDNLDREKKQLEKDLSFAERHNESLSRRVGLYDDQSAGSSKALDVTPKYVNTSVLPSTTPPQRGKRANMDHSTPILFSDDDEEIPSFESITKELKENLDRDDDLEQLAAELGVDIGVASTPSLKENHHRKVDPREDNLFSNVGFDGLGGVGKVKKNRTPSRMPFKLTQKKKSSINNFLRRI